MAEESELTGFDFTLKVDNHPDTEDEECFVVGVVVRAKQRVYGEVVASFDTIEQAEKCFVDQEKTAKKAGMVCVERTAVPEENGQWASESKWRRRHPVCS